MLQIFHKLRCIAKRYILLFYVIIYIYILQKKDNIACKEVWYFKCKELPLWYKMLIICSRHLYKILISRHQLKKYNYWQWLRSWSFYVRTYIWKKIYMETPLVLSDSYMQKWDPPPPHPCVELRTDGNLHTPSTDAFSFNERWPGTVAKPVHFSQSQKSKAAK